VPNAHIAGGPNVGTVMYHGGYVEVLRYLTGEHRAYNKKSATFDRVIPKENFFLVKGEGGNIFGRGAWQVGARYNYLNLNDKGIDGGVLNDVTLGLNWFLNPNMKIQANYSITARNSPAPGHDGTIQGVGVRVAHDF
jgi:phosphate-selective porin OprO/OprP